MTEDELLGRIAQTLKQDIGPAVESEDPRTQAFMAAVVLQKLSRQLRLARTHDAAERADLEALCVDLTAAVKSGGLPVTVIDAIAELVRIPNDGRLCELVEALYASRLKLGEARFTALLARVRVKLRANITRQMEYAG